MKKLKSQKKKNSILSLMLAILFAFTLNYTPISIVAQNILNSKKSNAYSSSTTQTYYGTEGVTNITTESNVSSGNYADGTRDYFTNSSNNYNILTNYEERYEDWFKKFANEYLTEQDKNADGYNGTYSQYLDYINYSSLGEYYDANKSSLSASSFRAYFESFVSSEHTFTVDETEYSLKALFSQEQTIAGFYQSYIYNSFANYLLNEQKGIENDSYGQADGLYAEADFYENSISYLRVKNFIDKKITATTVIYSFDGKTQADYTAAIIADQAPVSQGYYYSADSYESNTKTSFSLATHTYTPEAGVTYYMPEVYYFGYRSDLTNGSASSNYANFVNSGYIMVTYDSGNDYCTASYFELNTLYFRQIQYGEYGYMDDSHPTYYRYSSIPYDITNSNYEIYVVDDNVTTNEKATYDSLYYVHVITSDELSADLENVIASDSNGFRDTTGCFYVKVPYFSGSTSSGFGDAYFKKLFSSVSDLNYNNIVSLFTENGDSKIYFKISSSTYTSTTNNVYIDENKYDEFISKYPTFIETYNLIAVNSDDFYSNPDYYQITSSFSNYYKEDFELYFKQIRTYFTQTEYTYDDGYETVSEPNKEYEQTEVASDSYDNFDIYSKVDTFEVDGTTYKVVSSDLVNNGAFELISSENAPNSNYNFYYRHLLTSSGEIDSVNYETENNQRVIYVLLENINILDNSYKVITSESLELIRNLYVSVPDSIVKSLYGETETYPLYYKHSTEIVNQIYIVDDSSTASENEVYKNLNYKVITTSEYEDTYYYYEEIASTDSNYNSNFKLFYKLDEEFASEDSYTSNSSLFIQNEITGKNAIYIIDDSLTATDRATYKSLYYTTITTEEFNSESNLYVLINSNDSNYSSTYTKLYYKFIEKPTSERKIYIYSSSSSTLYNSFYNTDEDYVASDYELIQSDDPNYVPGTNLYYKKTNRNEVTSSYTQNSYYYYNTTSSVTLQANSYYAITFYVYTNGNYYDSNYNLVEGDVEASVYITDSKNVISDISIEHINTNGTWQKYTAFIATDALTTSTITLSLYMGDKNSIAGSLDATTISGTVMFDEIKIILIGETDYNKHTIDDEPVQQEITEYDTVVETFPIVNSETISESIEGTYEKIEDLQVDENRLLDSDYEYYYKHLVDGDTVLDDYELDDQSRRQIYVYDNSITSGETTIDITVKTTPHTYTDVDSYKNTVVIVEEEMLREGETLNNRTRNDSVVSNWNYNFNFDSSEMLQEKLNNLTFEGNEDGYTEHSDWHYYIGRENSGQGNWELLQSYQTAYSSGKVSVSVIDESTIDKTLEEDETTTDEENTDNTDDDDDEDEMDLETTDNTFINNNKVLKISNTDRLKSLGIESIKFTINQLENYKITVWIYSPDADATATVKLESILKTSSTSSNGSVLSATASNIKAHLADYDEAPTNEYCWIPLTFYIEGNAYRNQDVSLILLADKNSTVYFDNITIERITSSAYDTVNSDSDELTTCLALSPSASLISSGVTNGYFNLLTVTDNYVDIDYTLPRTAENWTAVTDNSTSAIAGVVPTSNDYTSKTENFFTKYNGGNYISTNGYANNVFAIYAPSIINSPLDSTLEGEFKTTHNYKIYSASMSLSSGYVYEISFEFLKGYEFSGDLTATLYASSVATANIVSTMKISSDDIGEDWTKYTFYVQTGLSSSTIYLEIGVENAVGTCFFQKASNIRTSYSSVNEVRDSLVASENNSDQTGTIYDYAALSNIRFVNLADSDFSINNGNKNDYGIYDSNNFVSSDTNESSHTVGESGTAVASYYTTTTSNYYTVEIKNLKYITGSEDNYEVNSDADSIFYIKEITTVNTETNESETTYKIYSDSMFTIEVVGFDVSGNNVAESSEISNFTITKTGSVVSINVDGSDTSATTVTETEYEYKFNNDVVINNVIIPGSELNNSYSQNVLILANSYSTDYISVSTTYTYSLSSSSYYVIRIYVKTSDMGDNGLNIAIDSVTVNWQNINTTSSSNADKDGFVCYELWVSTNTSSFSKVNITFSLGGTNNPTAGYAIIAGVEVEKMSNETLFNEYCNAKEELYVEDDSNSIAKRYYGTPSSSTSDDDDDSDSDSNTIWATFFYVFSSLLLGAVLIIAIVAAVIKKHPIKVSKKVKDDSFVVVEPNKEQPKKSKKDENFDTNSKSDNSESSTEEKSEDNNDSKNIDEGF